MSAEPPMDANSEHDDISGLLPWYVNGTLRDAERQRVEAHLQACDACRDDLRLEARVHAELASDAAVTFMPAASLKRLRARLDAEPQPTRDPVPAAERQVAGRRRWSPRRGLAAASLLAAGLVLGLAASRLGRESPGHADYYTVTTPPPPVPNAALRVVFGPQLSLRELNEMLDEAHLQVVGGPSEAGAYSLASTAGHDPVQALAVLRAHPAVRFAELTRPVRRPEPR